MTRSVQAMDLAVDQENRPVLVEANFDAWTFRDVVDKPAMGGIVRAGSTLATHREFIPDEWPRVPSWLAKRAEANGETNPPKVGHQLDASRLSELGDVIQLMADRSSRSPRKKRRYRFLNEEARRPKSAEDLRRQLEQSDAVDGD